VASSGTGTGGPNSSELPSGILLDDGLGRRRTPPAGPRRAQGRGRAALAGGDGEAPAVHDDFVQGRGSSHLGGHVLPACECRAGPGRAGEASGVGARPLSLRRILRPAALKAWQRLSIWSRISPTVVAWHGVGASSWSSHTARTVRPRLVWLPQVGGHACSTSASWSSMSFQPAPTCFATSGSASANAPGCSCGPKIAGRLRPLAILRPWSEGAAKREGDMHALRSVGNR